MEFPFVKLVTSLPITLNLIKKSLFIKDFLKKYFWFANIVSEKILTIVIKN